ncbi:E3 binding domain-containing protein [Roseivivax sediminis]|uniref:E3 binding domain-containing protein n=1 Tax=Roseivivax sediminis TaxID=936889 RepID=A0A1I1SU93_9RHOB|nr:E3 binding domain-containing protein [Roseivivax sediminis]SFD49921.1 e3 binding domain-containing protein [Roseivivax sediminis]
MEDSAHHWPEQPRVRASPLVRRLAAERGIDLSALTGSGPNGRIVEADLPDAERPAAAGPERAEEAEHEAPAAPLVLRRTVPARALRIVRDVVSQSHGPVPLWAFAAKALARACPEIGAVSVTEDLSRCRRVDAPGASALSALRAQAGPARAEVAVIDLGPLGLDAVEAVLPDGCTLALSLGAVRADCTCGAESLALALTADPAHWPTARAAALLGDVAALLEAPGPLLAGLPEV